MTTLCFIDTETTGLDPDRHQVWEVAMTVRKFFADTDPGAAPHLFRENDHHWLLPVNLERADPVALDIGGFHERHPQGHHFWTAKSRHPMERPNLSAVTDTLSFAMEFARLTHGAVLVGNVISFDEERLRLLLMEQGELPAWHYHLLDVEAYAAGFLAATSTRHMYQRVEYEPPWNSTELSLAMGVDPADFDRHTAAGDVAWARAVHDAVNRRVPTAGGSVPQPA